MLYLRFIYIYLRFIFKKKCLHFWIGRHCFVGSGRLNFLVQVIFIFGHLHFWSSSFCSSSFLVVFVFGRLPFWMRSSSNLGEVVFHFRSHISYDSKLYTV